MYRLEIPGKPPSLNVWYSGQHWSKRYKLKQEWGWKFLVAIREAKIPKLQKISVMDVTQFCKGRLLDSDNTVISAKFCGDALKEHGIIPDDSPQYIETVILRSRKGKEDKTVIVIS